MTETPAHGSSRRRTLAFFGGSFDPVHLGHLSTARRLTEIFRFDEFNFVPACHAPHKRRKTPTPALDRYAMLCLEISFQLFKCRLRLCYQFIYYLCIVSYAYIIVTWWLSFITGCCRCIICSFYKTTI